MKVPLFTKTVTLRAITTRPDKSPVFDCSENVHRSLVSGVLDGQGVDIVWKDENSMNLLSLNDGYSLLIRLHV